VHFLYQSDKFIKSCLAELGLSSLESLTPLCRFAIALEPVVIKDFRALTELEKADIVRQFRSEFGVAYFIVLNCDEGSPHGHPLIQIAEQLKVELNLHYPLVHPLEQHADMISRFGQDGTLKVYDVVKDSSAGYREQGETSDLFSMHHDGLGSGGTVSTVGLYMDSPPLSGGYTYFQNICRLALELARTDRKAFNDLFLPNAMTVLRPRGKGALRVTSPVLFVNEDGRPQSVFRTASGEYQISWRADRVPLARAMAFLNDYSEPFAGGSSFVHLTAKGHGCFSRNETIAHGRTRFLNAPGRTERVLARKWFMRHPRDAVYKHVPGLFLADEFARLYPEYFGAAVLEGEWRFDPEQGTNIRMK
jgi:Taurine catabolism dioxygenase TauD, TfdA family